LYNSKNQQKLSSLKLRKSIFKALVSKFCKKYRFEIRKEKKNLSLQMPNKLIHIQSKDDWILGKGEKDYS